MPETPPPYAVVLLVEENLTPDDAARIRSLHEGIEDPVAYHVLMPAPTAGPACRPRSAPSGDLAPTWCPAGRCPLTDIDPQELVEEAREESRARAGQRHRSARRRPAPTRPASSCTGDPVDALAAKIKEVDGREAIILTEEHFVAELLRLDWTSKARRHLDIPVLHLMEQENFDEQAGGGEGASLI